MRDKTEMLMQVIRRMQFMRGMASTMAPADLHAAHEAYRDEMQAAAAGIEQLLEKFDRSASCTVWEITRHSYHAVGWAILRRYHGILGLLALRPSGMAWVDGPTNTEIGLLLSEIELEARPQSDPEPSDSDAISAAAASLQAVVAGGMAGVLSQASKVPAVARADAAMRNMVYSEKGRQYTDWSLDDWKGHLGHSKKTIADTDMWAEIMGIRALARKFPEKLSRNRKARVSYKGLLFCGFGLT